MHFTQFVKIKKGKLWSTLASSEQCLWSPKRCLLATKPLLDVLLVLGGLTSSCLRVPLVPLKTQYTAQRRRVNVLTASFTKERKNPNLKKKMDDTFVSLEAFGGLPRLAPLQIRVVYIKQQQSKVIVLANSCRKNAQSLK